MNRFGSILQTSWDWRAAGNFMFGGTGSALMFLTAINSYPNSPPLPFGLSAVGFIGLGLLLVWFEIGRPMRFLHTYFHPQRSWMTREASVGIVLFVLALIGVFFSLPLIIALAGFLGLIYLYCQGRILEESKGIPAWRESEIVPLIIATGLCEGTAILLVLTSLLAIVPMWGIYLLLGLLLFRIFAWNRYLAKLKKAGAPTKTLQILTKIKQPQVIIGNIIPAIFLILALMMPDFAMFSIITAGLLTVLSGWQMKFTIVARASQVQGYRLGKLRKGRPNLTPPVRRKPDKFVF